MPMVRTCINCGRLKYVPTEEQENDPDSFECLDCRENDIQWNQTE